MINIDEDVKDLSIYFKCNSLNRLLVLNTSDALSEVSDLSITYIISH